MEMKKKLEYIANKEDLHRPGASMLPKTLKDTRFLIILALRTEKQTNLRERILY